MSNIAAIHLHDSARRRGGPESNLEDGEYKNSFRLRRKLPSQSLELVLVLVVVVENCIVER